MTRVQDNPNEDGVDNLATMTGEIQVAGGTIAGMARESSGVSFEQKGPAMSKRALVRRALAYMTGYFGVKQVREVLNHYFPVHSRELSENQLRSILSNFACRRIIGLRRNKAGRSPAVYETLRRPEPPFDIFRGVPNDGKAVWVATVSGLMNARATMEEFVTADPGPYFVFHRTDHTVLAKVETARKQNAATRTA